MQDHGGRRRSDDQLSGVLGRTDAVSADHRNEPLFFVRDKEIVDLCKKIFAEDVGAQRIFIRCKQATPVVADRSVGAIRRQGMRFIPDSYCDQFTYAFGVLSPRVPRVPPAEKHPLWMRVGRQVEQWRRKRLHPGANRLLDAGLSFSVTTVGPLVAPLLGVALATEIKARARLEICKGCEHYTNEICTQCGCAMKFKARLAGSKGACPVGKW